MSGNVNSVRPENPPKVLIVASNPAISTVTGWPIGFWWAELTHPYWVFKEAGYSVEIASPNGGALQADSWSDPRDESGYSADDLISLGFINNESCMALIQNSQTLSGLKIADYDALFLVGGQAPMITFFNDPNVHHLVRDFYEAGKVTAVVCHATAVLLKVALSDGKLLVTDKTWTGFADKEEAFADQYVGQKIQPFWIESEAKQLPDTNFVVDGPFKSFAIRDGHLITGQQQFSGGAAAALVVEALGR